MHSVLSLLIFLHIFSSTSFHLSRLISACSLKIPVWSANTSPWRHLTQQSVHHICNWEEAKGRFIANPPPPWTILLLIDHHLLSQPVFRLLIFTVYIYVSLVATNVVVRTIVLKNQNQWTSLIHVSPGPSSVSALSHFLRLSILTPSSQHTFNF